jgi:hypothetical protein
VLKGQAAGALNFARYLGNYSLSLSLHPDKFDKT